MKVVRRALKCLYLNAIRGRFWSKTLKRFTPALSLSLGKGGRRGGWGTMLLPCRGRYIAVILMCE